MVFSHGYRTRVYNSNNGAFWGRLVFDVPRIYFVFAQGCRNHIFVTRKLYFYLENHGFLKTSIVLQRRSYFCSENYIFVENTIFLMKAIGFIM